MMCFHSTPRNGGTPPVSRKINKVVVRQRPCGFNILFFFFYIIANFIGEKRTTRGLSTAQCLVFRTLRKSRLSRTPRRRECVIMSQRKSHRGVANNGLAGNRRIVSLSLSWSPE